MDFETFVQKSNECKTPDELYYLFTQAMAKFGFDRSVYSFLTPHPSIGYEAGHGVAYNYPQDWLDYYLAKKYQRIDPVPKHAFKTARAFSWDGLMKTQDLTPEEKQVMHEAEEAKLRSGVGIPLYGVNMEVAGFGLANSDGKVDITPPLLDLLQSYAQQFHLIYMDLIKKEDKSAIQLTPREKEVLLWLAEGKSLSEIGCILGVSDETIRSHKKAIYEKLEVNQRTLAVLQAIRNGLVLPYRLEL